MTFICYPKCTTCKKAQAWLTEQGKSFTVRDIKDQNPTEEELRQWHNQQYSYDGPGTVNLSANTIMM